MLSAPSFAASSSSGLNANASSFLETVETGVADILGVVELQKEDYGLGDVDFSSLSLGIEIPSYELTERGLVKISDVHYFPIIYNNKWVATAIISYSIYRDMNIELSVKYANDYSVLKESIDSRRSSASAQIGAALVFDSSNAFLYLGDDSILVESFQEYQGRASMNTYTGAIRPTTAYVIAERKIV
jgi:hypothetical protein